MVEEQHLAIDRLYDHDETLLIAGLGFGKAIVGLTALAQLQRDGVLKRTLVLAPLKVAELTWGPESLKWDHLANVAVGIACGSEKQRREVIDTGAAIIVGNFENAEWYVKEYGDTFDSVLVDEMSKLKSAGGATVKALRKWVTKLKWRAGMSGSPVAEASDDIYAQALLLDCGKALGTRKGPFLERFFTPKDFNRYKWEPRPGAIEQMAELLGNLVFTAADTAYKDSLPGIATEVHAIKMSTLGYEIYDTMDTQSVYQTAIAPNAAVRKGKLQQIAAGGLYDSDDKKLIWTGSHKMDYLIPLVEKICWDWGVPVIIVYNYVFELAALRRVYSKAPVIGGSERVTPQQIEDFNDGQIPVLLMHFKSGSHGLNLQGTCHTMIHMSPLWSADSWTQTIGRIHRRGQKNKCRRIVLVTDGTVEAEMLERVGDKAASEREFMLALGGVQ